jgi:hypothetical protein
MPAHLRICDVCWRDAGFKLDGLSDNARAVFTLHLCLEAVANDGTKSREGTVDLCRVHAAKLLACHVSDAACVKDVSGSVVRHLALSEREDA